MSSRRSGIMAARPEQRAEEAEDHDLQIRRYHVPHEERGIVKIVPLASDVDAEPMVCDRLASRIVPRARNSRNSATVMTAAGIDAETVSPTRRPR